MLGAVPVSITSSGQSPVTSMADGYARRAVNWRSECTFAAGWQRHGNITTPHRGFAAADVAGQQTLRLVLRPGAERDMVSVAG